MKRVLEKSKAEAFAPRLAYIMGGKDEGLKWLSSEEGACKENVIVLLLERQSTACTSPVDAQQRLLGGIDRIPTRESSSMDDDAVGIVALDACDGATAGDEVTAIFMMKRKNLSNTIMDNKCSLCVSATM